MTVAAWFKTTTPAPNGSVIVRKDAISGTRYLYGLSLNNTAGCPGATNKVTAEYVNGSAFCVTSANALNDGNWHHAAMTISGTTMTLYIDGVSQGSTTITGTQGVPNGELDVGASPPSTWNPSREAFFNGAIDEAYVYNRALSASEISALMNGTSPNTTNTYVYGATGLLYWVDGAGNPTYRLTDGLGSTVALCDAAGNVTATWAYDVFGAVRSHTGGDAEFTFTGEQNDPNGLEYLRARYYDPAVGRFLGRDPLGGGYPYAGNNPANLTNPSGLYAICGDNPTWGYICFDSTQVDLPLCTPEGVCEFYQGDGNVATVENGGLYCDFEFGACALTSNGDVYLAHHTRCFKLIAGGYACGSYIGNLNYPLAGVRVRGTDHPSQADEARRLGDFNCGGLVCNGSPGPPCMGNDEEGFLNAASDAFCRVNPTVRGCNGGTDPPPFPRPPSLQVFSPSLRCARILCLPINP